MGKNKLTNIYPTHTNIYQKDFFFGWGGQIFSLNLSQYVDQRGTAEFIGVEAQMYNKWPRLWLNVRQWTLDWIKGKKSRGCKKKETNREKWWFIAFLKVGVYSTYISQPFWGFTTFFHSPSCLTSRFLLVCATFLTDLLPTTYTHIPRHRDGC